MNSFGGKFWDDGLVKLGVKAMLHTN